MGGMTGFYFIPRPYVTGLPAVSGGIITSSLQIIGDGGFFSGYATGETLAFDEPGSQDDNGNVYKPSITGTIPGNYPAMMALFQEMESFRHLVLMRDPNGHLRLVGYENPLIFLGGFKSGAKAADYKGYSFTFSGESLQRAPYYLPA